MIIVSHSKSVSDVVVIVCLFVLVCRGKSSRFSHSENIEARYRQYRTDYAGCTYIDGNVELVFLTSETNYDLSFLQVHFTFLIHDLHRFYGRPM